MELVGIIRVPLSAFAYDASIGREHHPAIVKQLERVFQRTRCAPEEPSNHAEGAIDRETLKTVLSKLNMSLTNLRTTITNGMHPKVWLNPCILCIDGKQRIAAGKVRFGEKYWWTVRLFYCKDGFRRDLINTRALSSSHQAAKSDGDIFRFLRIAQHANRQKAAQALRLQLSPCKEKILNQLLRREPPEGYRESVVGALDSLLPYPGVWEGLEIANWHRYLALHWDAPIIHFLQNHIRATYDKIVQGVVEAQQYFDLRTVRKLALRCPQSKGDALFIQKSMKDGDLFHGLTDKASRRQILTNILSLNVIIPSLKTFHENMKYFAIGAKILRQHILSEDDANEQPRSFAQRLQWSEPPDARVEAGDGNFISLLRLDLGLATKALFLVALKLFPYVSHDRPKKDVRGEEALEPTVNDGFVYMLRREARRLGFSSLKVEEALAGRQPVCCKQFFVEDPQVGSKWRCGKPGLRAFLHLYKHAYLPTLGLVKGTKGLTPMFVIRDFLDAFFGPDPFADDGFLEDADVSGPSSSSAVQDQSMEVDMADNPRFVSDVPNQGVPVTQSGSSALKSKLSTKRAPHQSRELSGSQALRQHIYKSRGHVDTRADKSKVAAQGATAAQKAKKHKQKIREAVAQKVTQEVGTMVDPAGPPKDGADRSESRRSPVRPPELEPSVREGLDTIMNEVPEKASKASQGKRSLVRSKRRLRPQSKRRLREEKIEKIKNKKTKKRPATSETTFQVAEPSRNMALDPHVSFADTTSVLTAAAPALSDKAPALSDKKRKPAQVEATRSLREWISGTNRLYERLPKRRKNQHMHTSTASIAAYGMPSTTAAEEERMPNAASDEPGPRQRSPIAAPSSDAGYSATAPPSEAEAGKKSERKSTKDSLQRGHAQAGPSREEQLAPQAQSLEQESTEQEFHDVETSSEPRNRSPGLTYIDQEWGASHRSPVATPESDL